MKILLAAHTGYPWGGVSLRYHDLLNSNLRNSVELCFFETSPNKKRFSGTGIININNILSGVITLFKFAKIIWSTNVDIVHIASAQGASYFKHSLLLLISKAMGKKVILAPHCSLTAFLPKESTLIRRFIINSLNRCNGLLVLSSEWLVLSRELSHTAVRLLPNAINLSPLLKIDRPRIDGKRSVRFLYLGHMGRMKGTFDLIEAAWMLSKRGCDFVFDLYGEELREGDIQNLVDLVNAYGIDRMVHIHPPVFDQQKIRVIRDADVYVLPSYTEGMPISIIEAMAAGLPVIATNVGGIPDLIHDRENGLLVSPGEPHMLANLMDMLISKPYLCRRMGRIGRKLAAEQHDVNEYAGKLVSFYEEVLAST